LEKTVIAIVTVAAILVTIVLLAVGVQGIYGLTRALIGLGYLGAFLSGVLGTSSLMISIFPPQVVVFLMSAPVLGFNPLLVGILAGLGAGIGQYFHYYIGAGGRFLLSEKRVASMEKWRARLGRYGLLLIFLFAVTPLTPDDLLWIPLGMMKYPKLKALISAIVGKTVMLVLCAYGGYYSIDLIQKYLVGLGGSVP